MVSRIRMVWCEMTSAVQGASAYMLGPHASVKRTTCVDMCSEDHVRGAAYIHGSDIATAYQQYDTEFTDV